MQSSLIGKVLKARQYAQEPERIEIGNLSLQFRGENGEHTVSYSDREWHCSCHFFTGWGFCCHTMALERLLGVMVPVKSTYPEALQGAEALIQSP
ncbi:MAG: hypothetical protein CL878_01610 [Dehalococcoidia bacterium]|nr:hypothetical protein [Dehalococcoidia bacterium]